MRIRLGHDDVDVIAGLPGAGLRKGFECHDIEGQTMRQPFAGIGARLIDEDQRRSEALEHASGLVLPPLPVERTEHRASLDRAAKSADTLQPRAPPTSPHGAVSDTTFEEGPRQSVAPLVDVGKGEQPITEGGRGPLRGGASPARNTSPMTSGSITLEAPFPTDVGDPDDSPCVTRSRILDWENTVLAETEDG